MPASAGSRPTSLLAVPKRPSRYSAYATAWWFRRKYAAPRRSASLSFTGSGHTYAMAALSIAETPSTTAARCSLL